LKTQQLHQFCTLSTSKWVAEYCTLILMFTIMHSETTALPHGHDVQMHVIDCLAIVVSRACCAVATVYKSF